MGYDKIVKGESRKGHRTLGTVLISSTQETEAEDYKFGAAWPI